MARQNMAGRAVTCVSAVHRKAAWRDAPEMRFEGLNCRHTRSRSRASADAVGNFSDSARGRAAGSDSSIVEAKGELYRQNSRRAQ